MQNEKKNTEFEHFSTLANEWWSKNGKFKILHDIQPIRIKYILDAIKKKNINKATVLDIGCGGGLVSEGLSKIGATVTGIDFIKENINVAKMHAKKNNLKINYLNKSPEQINEKEKFDVVLNLEVVEHVDNLNLFLKSCCNLLKKNGIIFTATINRTFSSYIKAIIGAEYVLRWLPIGTHDWNKFLKPEELEKKFFDHNVSTKEISGLNFNPFLNKWSKSQNLSVNYIIIGEKN